MGPEIDIRDTESPITAAKRLLREARKRGGTVHGYLRGILMICHPSSNAYDLVAEYCEHKPRFDAFHAKKEWDRRPRIDRALAEADKLFAQMFGGNLAGAA